MVQVDPVKAFDCVNHEVLFMVLEHVNVTRIIIDGVRALTPYILKEPVVFVKL